jgi:hypothetical protein
MVLGCYILPRHAPKLAYEVLDSPALRHEKGWGPTALSHLSVPGVPDPTSVKPTPTSEGIVSSDSGPLAPTGAMPVFNRIGHSLFEGLE